MESSEERYEVRNWPQLRQPSETTQKLYLNINFLSHIRENASCEYDSNRVEREEGNLFGCLLDDTLHRTRIAWTLGFVDERKKAEKQKP